MTAIHITDFLRPWTFKDLLHNLPDATKGLADPGRSRYMISNDYLTKLGQLLETRANQLFCENDIKSSYSLYCKYYGKASMNMHKDDNACTYTIDLCVRQTEPWGLWVEDQEYIMNPNDAVCYYGNDQVHGRHAKDLGLDGSVELVFFHYVRPDHWFFTRKE